MALDVLKVSRIIHVIVNRVDHGPVSVNFLKGDLPFVVTLFAVHSHHGVQGCTVFKAELFRIFNRLLKVIVPVYQKVARDLLVLGAHVEGDAVSLGVPVGATPVFFTCKAFRPDVESGILTGVGLIQLKNVESDGLLRTDVTFNGDVGRIPDLGPGLLLTFVKLIIPHFSSFLQRALRCVEKLASRVVHRLHVSAVFEQGERIPALHFCFVAVANFLVCPFNFFFNVDEEIVQGHFRFHSRAHMKFSFQGFGQDIGLILILPAVEDFPEELVVIGILIHDPGIDVGGKGDFTIEVDGRDAVFNHPDLVVFHAQKARGIHFNRVTSFKLRYERSVQYPFFHIQLPSKFNDPALVQIEFPAVDSHIDSDPIRGVEHFGKVFGITVFPPAHSCFVRVVDPSDIAPLESLSAVNFLKIGTLPHGSVSKAEQAFGSGHVTFVKSLFYDFPIVGFDIIQVHSLQF